MDAWESHNYDKFTPSILRVAPSSLCLSFSLTHSDRHACSSHTMPPSSLQTPYTISPRPPVFHQQSASGWLMYAVKLLATMALTSPPPPPWSAHPSLRPRRRPHSNKFVTVRLWNIDGGREGDVKGLVRDRSKALAGEGRKSQVWIGGV